MVDSKADSDTAIYSDDLVITRMFDAARELVFKAWTDPKQMAQWWGPKGFTNPVCELDVRPGGAILIHMRGPDGVIYPMYGTFHEIVEPERLVMTTSAVPDEAGSDQLEVLNTITFAEGAKGSRGRGSSPTVREGLMCCEQRDLDV
jgi:uncharacterized protein YndB with AHSA1/START domain